jgi:hypothetical protein
MDAAKYIRKIKGIPETHAIDLNCRLNTEEIIELMEGYVEEHTRVAFKELLENLEMLILQNEDDFDRGGGKYILRKWIDKHRKEYEIAAELREVGLKLK